MATEYLNPQQADTGSAQTDTLTISSYVVPAGSDKKIIVAVFYEDSGTVADITDLKFDGTSMVLVDTGFGDGSSFDNKVTQFELDMGLTTPTGDIVLTMAANTNHLMLLAITVTELEQQAKEASVNAGNGSTNAISASITTITNNAIIISSGLFGSNAAIDVTGTDHVLISQFNVGGGSGALGAGRVEAGSAGSHGPLGWDKTGSNSRMALVLAAYEAVTAGGTTFFQTNTGSLTPSGIISKQIDKPLVGSVTPTGIITKVVSTIFGGSSTPSGILSTQLVALRTVSGSLTPAGDLIKLINKNMDGSSTPSGAIQKNISKLLAGSMTPSAALQKRIEKVLDGSLTPTGTVITAVVILVQLAGQVIMSGSLATLFIAGVAGVSKFLGKILKPILRPILKKILKSHEDE